MILELSRILSPKIEDAGYGWCVCKLKPRKGLLHGGVLHSAGFGSDERFIDFVKVLAQAIKHCGQFSDTPEQETTTEMDPNFRAPR
jgi:hypothetical protein